MNFILLLFALPIIESKKHLRIIGGRDAAENEYPYVARFEILQLLRGKIISRSHLCTSTILTSDWTLTAAHCVEAMDIFDIRRNNKRPFVEKGIIWYGHVSAPITKDAYSDVLYVVQHPTTILNFLTGPQNDIALVRTEPIKIRQYGKLSALDAKSLIGQEVHVVGYGLTNASYGDIEDTMTLKKPLQVVKAIINSCHDMKNMYPALCLASRCGVWAFIHGGDSGGPTIHPSGVVAINTSSDDIDVARESVRTLTVGYLTATSPHTDWISLITKHNA